MQCGKRRHKRAVATQLYFIMLLLFVVRKKQHFFLQFFFISVWPSNLPLMERTWHSHFTSLFCCSSVYNNNNNNSNICICFFALSWHWSDVLEFFLFNLKFYLIRRHKFSAKVSKLEITSILYEFQSTLIHLSNYISITLKVSNMNCSVRAKYCKIYSGI